MRRIRWRSSPRWCARDARNHDKERSLIMRLWQWIKGLYAREPVRVVAVLMSTVTAILGWLADRGWLDWLGLTGEQYDGLIVGIVGMIVLILSGGEITRQAVYPPAHVAAVKDGQHTVAGPASPIDTGAPVSIIKTGIEPYDPRHAFPEDHFGG